MSEIILSNPDDLRSIVSESVREAIQSELPAAVRRGVEKPYMTKKELMLLTGWSSRQCEYKKSQRAITFIRRGRTILFPTTEIYAYLEGGRVDRKRDVQVDSNS